MADPEPLLRTQVARHGTREVHELGAPDLEMMKIAGLGVSYNGKPVVRDQADVSIEDDLALVIPLLDRLS